MYLQKERAGDAACLRPGPLPAFVTEVGRSEFRWFCYGVAPKLDSQTRRKYQTALRTQVFFSSTLKDEEIFNLDIAPALTSCQHR